MKRQKQKHNRKHSGILLNLRFAYPPNSLSLCGPQKQKELLHYTENDFFDGATIEIMSEFKTLDPYLKFISYENGINDSFEKSVVQAYWIGNRMLESINLRKFENHLTDGLNLKKTMDKKSFRNLLAKLDMEPVPNHNFHVFNVYKRTNHSRNLHTLQTMDACRINWGKVVSLKDNLIQIQTKPLVFENNRLTEGRLCIRKIKSQGNKDSMSKKLRVNDYVSYHWGYFCHILSYNELQNLKFYSDLALQIANSSL